MAQSDWRRYYVPVLANGKCPQITYRNREEAKADWPNLVAIVAIKGKRVGVQLSLFGMLA